ncbi:MAG: AI-2E family transporter [Bacilli bacterium]|nr:AI-2E family transporter [Bacilli bacterium]
MKKEHINYKLVNVLLLLLICYIILITSGYWGGLIRKIFSIMTPFMLAFVFAYILRPFVKKLEDKGVRRPIALLSVVLIVLLIIIGLVWVTVPVVYDQLISFTKTVTDVINNFNGKFDIELGGFEKTILEALNSLVKDFGTYISTGTIDILGKSVNFLTNLMIIFIVGIYLLVDMEKIRAFIKRFLRKRTKKGYRYFKQLDIEIGNYLHGLAIFMIIQFFEYSVLFKIVGHPNWLLLGLLACFTTVIPYFGGIITNIIAVITATAISWKLSLATLIITLIFPNLDGYILSPHIYGKTNNVNPVLVIITMGFFSRFFGFIGIVIGLPAYIIIKCTWQFFDDDIIEKIQDVKSGKE